MFRRTSTWGGAPPIEAAPGRVAKASEPDDPANGQTEAFIYVDVSVLNFVVTPEGQRVYAIHPPAARA